MNLSFRKLLSLRSMGPNSEARSATISPEAYEPAKHELLGRFETITEYVPRNGLSVE